jgi:peptide/nickel transport system substrate-binding protein
MTRFDRRSLLQSSTAGALGLAFLNAPVLTRAAIAQDAAGEELVIANETEPSDLYPWLKGFGHALVARQIYETLAEPRLSLDAEGHVVIDYMPKLAESWERVDDLTWRFTLRQGVTFHNGEAFDANALKASYDIMGNDEVAAAAGGFNILRGTSSLTVVDDFTVDITTPAPNTEVVGYVLRLGLVALPPQKLADEGIESFAESPVGTGPYLFQSWERGQQVTLARNEEYWDAAFADTWGTVRYIARPEAAVRAQTVASGEADFAFNIGAEQAGTLENSVVGAGFQSTGIRINNQIEPTSNVDLRKALNHAIDRQGIVDAIFLGQAQPIAFFGFQPVELEPYAFDLELATQLVADAGLAGTELELVYGEGRIPEEDQLAELYKASFEAIGPAINLRKVEKAQYDELGGLPFNEQPALYMETTSSGNYAEIAGGLTDKYGSEGSGTFSDPAFDTRFAELSSLEGEERLIALQSIAEDLHELAPRAWVAAVQQVHGISDRITPDLPLNAYPLIGDIIG